MSPPDPADPTFLLDANVLIALTVSEHRHHAAAHEWLAGARRIAVCPITEGALVRFLLREGDSAFIAQRVITAIHELPLCEFWPDTLSYRAVDLAGVYGHRQVTDSYLVSLVAARVAAQLVTFDRALAARHATLCHLLPGG